jgi:hypothetical protein
MELRFINKTGNRHFDKPSYTYYTYKDLIHTIYSIFCAHGLRLKIGSPKNWMAAQNDQSMCRR